MIDQLVLNAVETSQIQALFKVLKSEEPWMWEDEPLCSRDIRRLSLVNLRLRVVESIILPFHSLTHLNLSFNRLTEIFGLSHLISLKLLDISHNRIAELSPVKNMIELVTLRCDHNYHIEKLEPIYYLTKLKHLSVSNSRINWEESVFLMPLHGLESLNLLDNPLLLEKPKFWEFLSSIKPLLKFLNGVRKDPIESSVSSFTSSLVGGGSHMGGGNQLNNDFLRTPDGRIMLTQARAYFTASSLGKLHGTELLIVPTVDPSFMNNTMAMMSGQASNHSQNNSTHRNHNNNNNNHHDNDDVVDDQSLGSSSSPTASRSQVNTQSRSRSPAHTPSSSSSSSSMAKGHKSNHTKTTTPHLSSSSSLPPTSSSSTSIPPTTSHDMFTAPEGSTVVRFGGSPQDTGAPLAFCLYTNHCGFAKWSPGGPTACSMESMGKLLCSYRNGSIATMVDPYTGGGSIMDPRGKCMLLISSTPTSSTTGNDHNNTSDRNTTSSSSQRIAKVMNKNNQVMAVYTMDNNGNISGSSNSINHANGNGNGSGNGTKDSHGNIQHSWRFDGLHMSFDPRTFEIKISLIVPDLYACTFSTLTGCSLSNDQHHSDQLSLRNKLTVGRDLKQIDLSHDDHGHVRTGIASVMSQLDDMMVGLKGPGLGTKPQNSSHGGKKR